MNRNSPSGHQSLFARSIGVEFADQGGGFPAKPVLPAALHAERFKSGGVSCYVAGKGPALLLVHSVNAAASAAQMRPLFEYCCATRTVFAIDLPGSASVTAVTAPTRCG